MNVEVKRIRRDMGLSLRKFAQALGMKSERTICYWESGEFEPSPAYKREIGRVYDRFLRQKKRIDGKAKR